MTQFIKVKLVDSTAILFINVDLITHIGEKPGDSKLSIISFKNNEEFNTSISSAGSDPLTVSTSIDIIEKQLKAYMTAPSLF